MTMDTDNKEITFNLSACSVAGKCCCTHGTLAVRRGPSQGRDRRYIFSFSYTMSVCDASNWWVEVTHIFINVFEKLFALCTGWYLFEAALNHNRSLSSFYEFWNDLHLFSVDFCFSPYLSFPREYTIGIINRF